MKNLTEQLLGILKPGQFFGPEDWEKTYGLKLEKVDPPITISKLNKLLESDCPFVPGKKVRDTHFLIFMPNKDIKNDLPVNIRFLESLHPADQQPKFHRYTFDGAWYQDEYFARKQTGDNNWLLVLKGIVPNSTDKNYVEQIYLLPAGYSPLKAIEMTAADLLAAKKTGKSITKSIYGRTVSQSSDGKWIFTGGLDQHGLIFDKALLEERKKDLGIFAAKKI